MLPQSANEEDEEKAKEENPSLSQKSLSFCQMSHRKAAQQLICRALR